VAVQDSKLTAQNVYLTEMLRQAGLDAEAQVVAARIQTVLTDEIHHRMKNMLTMVTAVVRQSMRSAHNLAEAESAIGARLIAMAKAHDLLLRADWQSANLSDVIKGAIEQHDTVAGRIVLEGGVLEIASSAILPLSLLLNELCTNATKYGSLSREGGVVTLSWGTDAEGKSLVVRWVESGGPPVTEPTRKSFGTRLIEGGIPRQFGGVGHLSFPASGVEFVLTVPLEKIKPVIPPLVKL
jgi:two-component sensor histidine kinase